jgi:hypothetical protein
VRVRARAAKLTTVEGRYRRLWLALSQSAEEARSALLTAPASESIWISDAINQLSRLAKRVERVSR